MKLNRSASPATDRIVFIIPLMAVRQRPLQLCTLDQLCFQQQQRSAPSESTLLERVLLPPLLTLLAVFRQLYLSRKLQCFPCSTVFPEAMMEPALRPVCSRGMMA